MKEPYIIFQREAVLTPAMQRMENLERIAWQVSKFSQSVLVAGATKKDCLLIHSIMERNLIGQSVSQPYNGLAFTGKVQMFYVDDSIGTVCELLRTIKASVSIGNHTVVVCDKYLNSLDFYLNVAVYHHIYRVPINNWKSDNAYFSKKPFYNEYLECYPPENS